MPKDKKGHGSNGKQTFFQKSIAKYAPPRGFNTSDKQGYMRTLRVIGSAKVRRVASRTATKK